LKIDRDEARRIAELAHLEFDDASLDRLAAEMTKILAYVETLRDVEVKEGGQTGLPVLHMREDVVRPSLDRDGVERNAPSWSDGFFVVPKVIENKS
jgi:aspartyl-tRNA(Asn)/glutamyl-tRNA(Gln) amidotransferase subunit C